MSIRGIMRASADVCADRLSRVHLAMAQREVASMPEDEARVVAIDPAVSFEAFFEAETDTLFRRLCLITGNRAEAEEIAQDAFLKIWERWDRVADLDDRVGYLYRVAMNVFRNRSRRARLAIRKTADPELRTDEFGAAEVREGVARGLSKLTPRQRAAVVLVDLLGYGSEEAGKMLGIRAGTVRSLVIKARKTLREELEERP
jgi:RNA polymerase sigma factor (sigma-70 family)